MSRRTLVILAVLAIALLLHARVTVAPGVTAPALAVVDVAAYALIAGTVVVIVRRLRSPGRPA